MEPIKKKNEKFTQSLTFKGLMVGLLTIILLIPGAMIQDLIRERQSRSYETINTINQKWSDSQTICGPVLNIPYEIEKEEFETVEIDQKKVVQKKSVIKTHVLSIAPEQLIINSTLFPEERHYGIYKTILYKSENMLSGEFPKADFSKMNAHRILWEKAYITMGVSDLRGITNNLDFILNNKKHIVDLGGIESVMGKELTVNLGNDSWFQADKLAFSWQLNLNGSSNINYIPLGKVTVVNVNGAWNSPGFIGNFSPEHTIGEDGFSASWNVLHFNRNIPEKWIDSQVDSFYDSTFGVNLVDTVDHYQQNMRSAKYSLMFIALTFVVFFFVEILTKKRIHPIQYLLVGIALILFYSLLLSISEQLNFGLAYIIASIATITLITVYAHTIFKNKTQTGVLALILCGLYIFLYVVLQLEDIALLIGSIGLFIILGVIMYFSRKISFYKSDDETEAAK